MPSFAVRFDGIGSCAHCVEMVEMMDRLGGQGQVIRVDTMPSAAPVVKYRSLWDWRDCELVGEAMRSILSPSIVESKKAVSIFIDGTHPYPTTLTVVLIDHRPEAGKDISVCGIMRMHRKFLSGVTGRGGDAPPPHHVRYL